MFGIFTADGCSRHEQTSGRLDISIDEDPNPSPDGTAITDSTGNTQYEVVSRGVVISETTRFSTTIPVVDHDFGNLAELNTTPTTSQARASSASFYIFGNGNSSTRSSDQNSIISETIVNPALPNTVDMLLSNPDYTAQLAIDEYKAI